MHSGLEGLRVSNNPMMARHCLRHSISCRKNYICLWQNRRSFRVKPTGLLLLRVCCNVATTKIEFNRTNRYKYSLVHKPVSKRASKWKSKGWEWLPMRLCLLKTRDFSATSFCSFTRKLSKKQRITYQHLQAHKSSVGWQSTLWGKQAFCTSKLKGHHRFQLQCL